MRKSCIETLSVSFYENPKFQYNVYLFLKILSKERKKNREIALIPQISRSPILLLNSIQICINTHDTDCDPI